MQAIVEKLNNLQVGEYITVDIKESGQQILCKRVVEIDGDASLSAIHISIDDVLVIKVGYTKFYSIEKFQADHLAHSISVADLNNDDRLMNILRFLEPDSIWALYAKRRADNVTGVYSTLT